MTPSTPLDYLQSQVAALRTYKPVDIATPLAFLQAQIAALGGLKAVSLSNKRFRFRLYDSQAIYLATNLATSRLHEDPDSVYSQMDVYLLNNTDHPTYVTCLNALVALGIRVVPGLRTFVGVSGLSALVSIDHWTDLTTELEFMAALRQDNDPRVYFDTENYAGSGSEATPAVIADLGGPTALRVAMQPFLSVFRDLWVVPCFTPGGGFYLDQQAMVQNSWTMEDLDEGYEEAVENTLDPQIAVNVGNVLIRRGNIETWYSQSNPFWYPLLNQYLLMKFGQRFLDESSASFAVPYLGVWYTGHIGYRQLGTQAWLDGTQCSSLNDCLWYRMASADDSGTEWNGGGNLEYRCILAGDESTEGHAPALSHDPILDYGAGIWFENQRYMYDIIAAIGRPENVWTIALDVYRSDTVNAAVCGVWLTRQGGYQSWQVRSEGGFFKLDVANNSDVVSQAVISIANSAGWNRLVLTFNGTQMTLRCGAASATWTGQPKVIVNYIGFQVGIGNSSGGHDAANRLYSANLRFKNLMFWSRVLTTAKEIPVALQGDHPYPWGVVRGNDLGEDEQGELV